jgi:4-amino-4-deoxy-L-arabinose transferase-like glycosyltransferase
MLFASALALTGVALRIAAGGLAPKSVAAVIVPGAFLALVVTFFRAGVALGPFATDETGAPRPLFRRHGFWVIVASTLLGLPMLGNFGLIDPWESHYAEVSREMLSRGDFISTWWAHEGLFLSKPVLEFWMQAIAMASFGVGTDPGTMLVGIAGHVARPEWAVRFPNFLLATIGSYALYKGVSATMGRRAGLFGALILVTTPQWFLLGHQSTTDMPLVACLSASMGLLLLAMHTDEDAIVTNYAFSIGKRTLHTNAMHLVLVGLAAIVTPQLVYLVHRNIDGVRIHADTFFSGSTGNCDLPGQLACAMQSYSHGALQPALQAVLSAVLLGTVIFLCHAERRLQRVLFLAAWLFAGLATMDKGPVGLVLPLGVAFIYAFATGRVRILISSESLPGILLVAGMVLPWYLAMYARHGKLFVDELVLKHMIGRTLEHIHDTNEGDDTSFRYYVWQLGYALFPWSGIVAAAALWWARSQEGEATKKRNDPSTFFVVWGLLAFGLFTTMLTKFHHYIFPAVPPLAMLTGIWLDKTTRSSEIEKTTHDRLALGGVAVVGAVLVAVIGRDLVANGDVTGQARLLHLICYQYHRAWPSNLDFRFVFAGTTFVATWLTMSLAVPRWRARGTALFVAFAIAFALFGLDVYLVRLAPHWGQRELIEAYYANRGSDKEPLIAYQMNWKGENFYTGNKIALFVTSGAPMVAYVKRIAAGGSRAVYVVLEHGRFESLRNELRGTANIEAMTGVGLNNKFLLVRARLEGP